MICIQPHHAILAVSADRNRRYGTIPAHTMMIIIVYAA
jgi:hypothetical protein